MAVEGGQQFAEISLGILHTCGLAIGGAVYCWGHVGFGAPEVQASRPVGLLWAGRTWEI